MDSALKQRLIGAAVLVALAMIFLPMLLKGPEPTEPDAAQVPLEMPAAPDQEFETRELPLTVPAPVTSEDGVLGLDTSRPAAGEDPDALVTIGPDGRPVGGSEPVPEDTDAPADAPQVAVDAATGEAPPQPATPEPVPAAPAPAATTPPPAAPLPVATAGGRYMVNVGSFSNLANARALADKLRAQGLPLTSESVDVNGKPAMRLRVGPYAERAVAEAARLRVEGVAGGSATVVALEAGASPASTPAAPAPRPAAAADVGFAVQLGALSSEADANALRDRARAAGFVAFHQRVNTDRGAVWRVRVGPEADRAAADRLRASVIEKLGLKDAIVVPHP